ncbi:MAG: phosphate-starvation-inducible PsiE family protein [Pseudomonadota bacterium]
MQNVANILQLKPRVIFDKTITIVFGVILGFITLAMILGVVQLFYNLLEIFIKPDAAAQYHKMISHILTLFILVELSRSLVEYFDTHMIKITFIIDASLIFVLREIMINLFEQKVGTGEIYALSGLLLVIGILRIGAVWAQVHVAKQPS